jgi:membrane protein implicated in regulation of membrane protease activity
MLLALYSLPMLIVVDEFFLDWSALLPGTPVLVATGLVPLAGTLLGLALLYALFWWLARRAARREPQPAGRPEALVGLFSFLMTGLIVLTVIGVFFRGPNMALIWPF